MISALLALASSVALVLSSAPALAQEPQGFVKPASPIPVTSYVVDVPSASYKSKHNKEAKVSAQLLFLDENAAKKAFASKEEIQKLIEKTYASSKQNFKSAQGKIALKGEVMTALSEKGYTPDGVLWNAFVF